LKLHLGAAYSDVKAENNGTKFKSKSSAWKGKARSAAVSNAAWDDGLNSMGNRMFAGMD
jgi:hypothetical protein